MKERNQNTENMRTQLTNDMLKESVDILQSIINVCTDVRMNKSTFSQACRKYNLDPNYTRRLILNFLGKCPDNRIDLHDLEFDFVDGFEQFYKVVFGDRALKVSKLPVDYKKSIIYVLNATGLTGQETLVLKLYFGLKDEEPMTLREIGDIIGVTRARIRQIVCKGLRKCRQQPRQDILKLGLTAYMQKKKQDEELARQALEYQKEEHEAVMSKKRLDHEKRMDDIKSEVLPEDLPNILENTNVPVLDLSARAYNGLYRSGIRNLYALIKNDEEDLTKIRNMGRKSLDEINMKLDKYIMDTYGTDTQKLREILRSGNNDN